MTRARPRRRGFQRVSLRPGASQRARFRLGAADFHEVVHPAGLGAAAAARWAVELGPVSSALARSVPAPWGAERAGRQAATAA